jgi:hypothetical protein
LVLVGADHTRTDDAPTTSQGGSMSTIAGPTAMSGRGRSPSLDGLRSYFFSDVRRTVQTFLGLIWLLDGGLQFQSFMYSKGFIQMLTAMSPGQPHWLGSSVNWGANTAQHNLSRHGQAGADRLVRLGACGVVVR